MCRFPVCPRWFTWLSLLLLPLAGIGADAVPVDPVQGFAEARQLARAGETEAAIARYRALLEADPAFLEAANNLAALYARDGRLDEARKVLEAAIAARPDFATIYRNLGAVYLELSRADYGKALQLKVGDKTLALRELDHLRLPAPAAAGPAGASPETPIDSATEPPASDEGPRIQQTLRDWAAAWSSQQPERYLDFYARGFEPAGKQSRASWEAQRRERLRRPKWIRVQLQDVQILEQDAQTARVRLLQRYRSDSYADQTRKELRLRKTAAGWRIIAERSL
jgi:ketosteroid isomerase-like protein